MEKGKIRYYTEKFEWGFITIDGSTQDVWFHVNDCLEGNKELIKEGAIVQFLRRQGPKGPIAKQIKVLSI